MPSLRAASRMVAPSGTDTDWPSILISIMRGAGAGGATGTGPRGMGINGWGAIAASSVFFTTGAVGVRGFMKIDSIAGEPIQWRWRRFVPGHRWRHRAWPAPSL